MRDIMVREMDWNQITIAILAIGILVLSGYYVYSSKAQAESTLDVTGTAKLMVDPDKVEVYVTAETQNESANVSQTQNADIMQAVRSALADIGIRANDTETTSFYLYPVKEYDRDGNVIFSGYKTVHTLKVTSSDLSKAGGIVDAAVGAGANQIDNIVFSLTDSKRDGIKAKVVNSSIDDAKQKADSMASRMGVKIVKVKHFSESSVYISPYPMYDEKTFSASVPTEITPGQIEVSASVTVTYQIE